MNDFELTDEVHAEIKRLAAAGDELAVKRDYREAIAEYRPRYNLNYH